MYPYLVQGGNIIIVIDSKSHVISKSHISYEQIKDAIKTGEWELIKELIEPVKVILKYSAGRVRIDGDVLFWGGTQMDSYLSTKIISMFQEGFPIDPMINFMDNLMLNPSNRAVTELYGFLEKGNMPITSDGCFLAYKKVRNNYFDVHSNTMNNAVGQVVSMVRNAVDDNSANTCSTGLHFCSLDYLSHFGGEKIMIVKINPRDVVSIPADYNDTKGRACCYTVIGELNASADNAFVSSVQENGVGVKATVEDTIEQVYDSRGRPLSMTTNAIRKRAERAAKK